jgi:hypothetical protein
MLPPPRSRSRSEREWRCRERERDLLRERSLWERPLRWDLECFECLECEVRAEMTDAASSRRPMVAGVLVLSIIGNELPEKL